MSSGEPEEIQPRKVKYVPEIHRMLPESSAAECGVIASILLDPRRGFGTCREFGVTPEWFHSPGAGTVFSQLSAMDAEGRAIDPVTLTQWIRDKGLLEACAGSVNGQAATGIAYIAELFTFLPTATNADYYAGILLEKFTLRELIKFTGEFGARAYEEQDNIPALLDEAESKLCALLNRGERKKKKLQKDLVFDLLEMLEAGDSRGVWGVSFGFPNLDLKAKGARAGQAIAVGGDTKSGKTALVENIIDRVCVQAKEPARTLFISLENTASEVNEELLQIGSGYSLDEIMHANTHRNSPGADDILKAAERAAARLAQAPLVIEDDAELNILQFRSMARKIQPRFIVLDYAQLCDGENKKYERDELKVAGVSRNFKKMCGELGATGFLITQLTESATQGGQVRKLPAGSRSILKDANQYWVVEDGEKDQFDKVIEKRIRICAGRRVTDDSVSMKWIGKLKKMLPKAV